MHILNIKIINCKNNNMILTFFLGIIASATHVMTGPDHLAAVTPLAIENKKNLGS